MSAMSLSTIRQSLGRYDFSGLGIPALVLVIMAMLVVPLPPLLLDVLFTFNILVGLVVIMIAINTRKPLEFSSFPSVLLFATMMRLALNVASTRVILVHGHEGHDAAGKVIASVCHGPWVLISAGIVRGRRLTCYPGCADDLINAGALYEAAPVVVGFAVHVASYPPSGGIRYHLTPAAAPDPSPPSPPWPARRSPAR